MNNLEIITKILKKDKRLWSEDADPQLLKAQLISLISQDDEKIIGLLISEKKIQEQFFKRVGEVVVFKKERFLQLVTMNEFLPDSFTAFENKIGLQINGSLLSKSNDVSLVFPHKDCILEGGQTREESKRDEIFFNTTLAPDEVDRLKEPKVFTNATRINKDGGKKATEISEKDNLIIKGNNLLALYSLLPKYRSKVKLIYIDPPYNTGSDSFNYRDNFNHSAWLVFMKNRLELAKQLLSETGSFFMQIDHHEVGYVNLLLDEVFGSDNKVQLISIKTASPAGFKTVNPGPIDVTEYILFYTKDKKNFKFKKSYVPVDYNKNYNLYLQNDSTDIKKWKLISIKEKVLQEINFKNEKEAISKFGTAWKSVYKSMLSDFAYKNAENIVSIRDPHKPTEKFQKILDISKKDNFIHEYTKSNGDTSYVCKGGALAFYSNKMKNIDGRLEVTELLTDFWSHISWAGIAGEGGVRLKNGKKPEKLIKQILEIATQEGDLILDYHLGSGTTAAVAHKMNRRYIGIEQIDSQMKLATTRLENVINADSTGISKKVDWAGGGNFVYMEILEWNQKYIDLLEKAKNKKDILFIKEKIEKEAFYKYQINFDDFDQKEFDLLSVEDQKHVLCDVLDLNHLYVNLRSVDDTTFKVSDTDKKFNEMFHNKK